jgi:uncharacterized protein DUF6174
MNLEGRGVGGALRGLVIAASLAAACSTPNGPSGPQTEPARLQRNLALWRQAGITSYQMRQENPCACPAGLRGPARVTVRDGRIVSRVLVATGQPVPPEFARYYNTIEELFSEIQRALDEPFYRVFVEYDPQLGHPTRMRMDWRRDLFDDDIVINVDEMTPLR